MSKLFHLYLGSFSKKCTKRVCL